MPSPFNTITSPYGPRSAPTAGASTFHQGTDIAMPVGTVLTNNTGQPLYLVYKGVEGGYGNYAEYSTTPDGTGTTYAFGHLSELPAGEVGTMANPGDGLALSGDSGTSTGAHVHVEVFQPGQDDASAPQPGDLAGIGANGVALGSGGTDPGTGNITVAGAGTAAPSSNGGGGAGGAGAGAAAAAGASVPAAGCLGASTSIASLLGGAGLASAIGGVAANAVMAGGLALLSGGGLQGALGAVLGSAGGALGNALGASLGGAAGAIVGQTLGGALGSIAAGANPLQALSGAAFGALGQMGGSLIPALSGVMPAALASAAVGGLTGILGQVAAGVPKGAAAQFILAGGLGGAIGGAVGNMTGNFSYGAVSGAVASGLLNGSINLNGGSGSLYSSPNGTFNPAQFANNIAMVAATASNNRNMVGAISEAVSQGFGATQSAGYGARTRNMQDALTFSVSTLGQNLNAVSSDMLSLGKWDATNLMRLMQPGNIATQILMKGLGDYTGLNDALVAAGVPLAGLDNPLFDRVTQTVLNGITEPEVIYTVKAAFAMNTNFANLGELTNLSKMMPMSFQYLPVKSFRELGVQLAIIGVSASATIYDIGFAFSKIETATDLNNVAQMNQPLPPSIAQPLMELYGYGGGTFGEQTMADFIGSAAGYVHNDTIPVINDTTKYIENHPDAALLTTLIYLFKDTMDGKYTTLGTPGDTASGIPGEDGYITVPFPAGLGGSQTFTTLDAAVLAFIPLIEAQQQALLNSTDPLLQDNITKLSLAYEASCAQLVRENNNLLNNNINLFDAIPPSPSSCMMFTQMLDQWGLQTGYGQPGEYIERVATNDIFGDAMKYCMRQARNASALSGLGIDVEQYKIPRSQYYREPEGFYNNLYTGQMPPMSQNRRAPVYPRTPTDVYLNNRNTVLRNTGYGDLPLQANQMDEIYYDSIWMDTSSDVLEGIGRSVVKQAIDNSIYINNDDLLIVNLTGATTAIGKIANNGLLLTNNEFMVTTLMQIVNKLLYGDLSTTKYTNPFNTDQMIYGVLEMLAQLTNQNIDALMKTVTGGLIANGLLARLMQQFGTSRSIYDTRMSRNDPEAWGGTGGDAKLL